MNTEEYNPEKRSDIEMRQEVDNLKDYLFEVAQRLDQQIAKDRESGLVGQSHEVATLSTQLFMIQNRLIHCCGGKLRRERPNEIFHDIAKQMTQNETRGIILEKAKKGVHDEK